MLDIELAGYAGGRITGDVMINGHPQKADSFARVSGYVEQTGTRPAGNLLMSRKINPMLLPVDTGIHMMHRNNQTFQPQRVWRGSQVSTSTNNQNHDHAKHPLKVLLLRMAASHSK